MDKKKIRHLVTLSLLITLGAIFGYLFSIENQVVKISFVFIPRAIIGALYSPFFSSLGSGVADFLGMLLFGKTPYFVGFGLNSVVSGVIYGYFFKKETSLRAIVYATITNSIIISMILTPTWLMLLYKIPLNLYSLWIARLVKVFIDVPIQVFILKSIFQISIIKKVIATNYSEIN